MINFNYLNTFRADIKSLTSNFLNFNHVAQPVERLVNKDGTYSIQHVDHPNSLWKTYRNGFQMLLKIKWRYVWLILCMAFPITWAFFALLYYGVSYWHGDFVELDENLVAFNATRYPACIANSYGYLSMFLFSFENQETIGYGLRVITEECPLVLLIVCIQIVAGAIFKVCFCVVIWVRILRPKRRGEKIVFSRNACVYLNEEKKLCLAFRLSDIDGTHLVQSCIRLYVAVKQVVTDGYSRGRGFSFTLYPMHMGDGSMEDKMLFLWPTMTYHVINEASPLYGYGREELEKSNLEFILVAEGVVESTGLIVQTRTSYLATEILWGFRFLPMNFCEMDKRGRIIIKYNDFDKVCSVIETPPYSAKELDTRLHYHEKEEEPVENCELKIEEEPAENCAK